MSSYTPPSNVSWFYGRLLREEAMSILNKRGCKNGLFLLRERLEETGSFTLSICYDGDIHHYKIDRQDDGTVKIDKGKKFIGPIELVRHHQNEIDGLITRPSLACDRPKGIPAVSYLFVNNAEFHSMVEREIKLTSQARTTQELNEARGRYRYKYERAILKNIHLTQPWFRKNLNRYEANDLLRQSGLINGKFLIRSKGPNDVNSYIISLCFNQEVKHYKINYLNAKYSLEGGKEFASIIQMVDYYHRCADGLLEKLLVPFIPSSRFIDNSRLLSNITNNNEHLYDQNRTYIKLMNNEEIQAQNYLDDEPNNQHDVTDLKDVPDSKRALFEDNQNYTYDHLLAFNIDYKDLIFYDKLGSGCFGSVTRGTYKIRDNKGRLTSELPVAIKTLNIENEDSKHEILKEAQTMQTLNHPNIIKLIGMCCHGASNGFNGSNTSKHHLTTTYMIVLELAKLGPLHKYLRNHKDMSIIKIIKLMYQISLAMEYLSSMNLVHRDLAARNVLLVNEDIAKISDFGMSRKMNENSYYLSQTQGKWPLKWYPPEASTMGKFDEKSDVWSYGITCWEATSYGCRPYQGVDINMLILKLENGYRLEKPEQCPDEVYSLMYKCWHADKSKRPTFSDIVKEMKQILNDLYNL